MMALGMIETWGIPALIAAADAAAKTADVKVAAYDKADAGIVTVYIWGSVSAVKAAVAAGEAEAKRVGKLLATHVIARPDLSLASVVRQPMNREASIQDKVPASDLSGLELLSVEELRKRARNTPGFPLIGRTISSAKKSDLIRLFMNMKQ